MIEVIPRSPTRYSGLTIDERARVLDEQGAPIAACSRPAPTPAACRIARTPVAWRRGSSSASRPPRRPRRSRRGRDARRRQGRRRHRRRRRPGRRRGGRPGARGRDRDRPRRAGAAARRSTACVYRTSSTLPARPTGTSCVRGWSATSAPSTASSTTPAITNRDAARAGDAWTSSNRVLAVNLTGPLLAIQTLAPLMTDGGSIVNVVARSPRRPATSRAAYTASKWALRGLSRVASMELGRLGIRVNTDPPRACIVTPMAADAPAAFTRLRRRRDPARPPRDGGGRRTARRLPDLRRVELDQRRRDLGRRRAGRPRRHEATRGRRARRDGGRMSAESADRAARRRRLDRHDARRPARRVGAAGGPARVPRPEPGPGEVLLEVRAAGLCHSDLHLMEWPAGTLPYALPFTLGHEVAGVVAALGAGATGVEVGDSVLVYGPWGCGCCPRCSRGEEHLCERGRRRAGGCGLGRDGGLADYVVSPVPAPAGAARRPRSGPRRAARGRWADPVPRHQARAAAPARRHGRGHRRRWPRAHGDPAAERLDALPDPRGRSPPGGARGGRPPPVRTRSSTRPACRPVTSGRRPRGPRARLRRRRRDARARCRLRRAGRARLDRRRRRRHVPDALRRRALRDAR